MKAAYTLREVLKELGIGRSKLYSEIAHGRIRAKKLGSRTIILGIELQRYIDELPDADIAPYDR